MGTIKFYLVAAVFIYGAVQVMMTYPGSAFHHDVALTIEFMGLLSVLAGLYHQLSRSVDETG